MKNYSYCLVVLLVFICQSVSAQDDIIMVRNVKFDSVTSKGKPVGEESAKKIGKDGGTIVSADGKFSIEIPEGALKRNTEISIQAVTNQAPNGCNNAYRLEPSNIKFEKPVKLTINYDGKSSAQQVKLKRIGWQDESGKWNNVKDFTVDTVAKTLVTHTDHFSVWTHFEMLTLTPPSGRLKTGKRMRLEIVNAVVEDDELAPLPVASHRAVWSVNGVRNGSSVVGTISSPTHDNANYTAPATVPNQNPVAVSVELRGFNDMGTARNYDNLYLVSNILIYENAYELRIDSWNDNTMHGACTMRVTDWASCVIQLDGTRSRVVDINNSLFNVPLHTYCCPTVWHNRLTCLGPIHIPPVSNISITPANPPTQPYAKVRVIFATVMSPSPSITITCPKVKPTTTPSFPMPSGPKVIEFTINDQEQTVLDIGDRNNGMKAVIKPIRD